VGADSDSDPNPDPGSEAGSGSESNPDPAAEPEFTFELRVCAWAEREWPPARERESAVLVARQLGTRGRRWDTLVLECDPEGLAARERFGPERLDSDLLPVVRHAPAEWTYYRDAIPEFAPWRYVREAVNRAADRGVIERRKVGNRVQLRRKWPYPDWLERLVAIENKPDLDASAADALADQLQRDVALALADEAWVATRTTGETVAPALLRRLPVEAGILGVADRARSVSVAWHAAGLPVGEPGTRILERPAGGEHDRSAARFEYADPDWKARKRLEIAERAYERGWRSYVDTMRPDCRWFRLARDAGDVLPWCGAHGRSQTAGECAGSCEQFEPEPPSWRSKGWPIEGGPGAAARRLLAQRRSRRR
jgi:hypothetical protein